jgi:HAE1 family hydrophobic/amphiphilic exporter-1
MSITHLALKRPIAVSMIFLALGLVGFLSWQRLPLELMPSLNYPQLTVVANCENVAPLEMEALVTKVLESSLGTVSRVRKINSISREGVSLITLDFDWGTNMNYASLNVREKLDQVRDLLPKEASTPIVIRYDPTSLPVMTLSVKGGRLGFEDLQELVSGVIKRDLERVGGVASARLSGAREREIRVAVYPGRLLAQKISISALVDALKQANLNYPGGKITQHHQELNLRVLGEFKQLSDLDKVGVFRRQEPQGGKNEQSFTSGLPAFIREVAEVQDTFKEEQSIARLDGQPSLILSIFKMADANTLQVVDRVKARVAALNQEYQGRLHILVAQDQGRFIQQAIGTLEEAALLGGLLSFGVLFSFLASLTSAVIIMTAIPISILATFSLMYLAGISLNMMSLGGLALGVGMLVDNGVVVLENIRRHEELGQEAGAAAIVQGTDEVKMAVTASTLAHIVVFVPVIFVAGLAGQFLYQVGLTISFSLLISLAVALILNPMLVSLGSPWIARGRVAAAPTGSWAERLKDRLDGVYTGLLTLAFQQRRPVLATALGLTALGALVLLCLGRELLPPLDQREFLLRVSTPPNTSLAATSERLKTIEDLLLAHPGVQTVITQLGYNPKEQYEKVLEEKEPRTGTLMVTLKPRGQYAKAAAATVEEIRPRLSQILETKIEYIFPQSLGQWLSQKPQLPELLTFQGPELEVLENLAQSAMARLKGVPGLQDLETSLKKENQESRVVLDRERAASFGLSVKEIGETLKVCIQGEVPTQFRQADRDIDIRVQLMDAKQQSPPELAKIYIRSKLLKTDIPLQAVARIESGPGLTEVHRRDQERLVAIQGNVAGRSLGEAQQDIKQALEKLELPPGYTLAQSGEALEMGRSFKALFWALMLSVLLVYMILAGQFESLLNPLIILLAVPFSLVGVALTLWLTGWGISLGVYFGGIMLGGIVVNNSILLIDYTNTLRRRGYGLREAVFQGSRARLRPIIMTTLTTSLGLLPLVLSRGEGAELRVPLALTVLGGLLASTFLTLILVPLLYLISEEMLAKWRRGDQGAVRHEPAAHP